MVVPIPHITTTDLRILYLWIWLRIGIPIHHGKLGPSPTRISYGVAPDKRDRKSRWKPET